MDDYCVEVASDVVDEWIGDIEDEGDVHRRASVHDETRRLRRTQLVHSRIKDLKFFNF